MCTGQRSLLWGKFKLEPKVSHLWKWYQEWDVTFLNNELNVPYTTTSFAAHLDCWEFAKKNVELAGWISYRNPLSGCESTYLQEASPALAHSSCGSKSKDANSWWRGSLIVNLWRARPFSNGFELVKQINSHTLLQVDGSSILLDHANWAGIFAWLEHPCMKNEAPFSSGFKEASCDCRSTSMPSSLLRHS